MKLPNFLWKIFLIHGIETTVAVVSPWKNYFLHFPYGEMVLLRFLIYRLLKFKKIAFFNKVFWLTKLSLYLKQKFFYVVDLIPYNRKANPSLYITSHARYLLHQFYWNTISCRYENLSNARVIRYFFACLFFWWLLPRNFLFHRFF